MFHKLFNNKKVSITLFVLWAVFIFVMSSFQPAQSDAQSGFFVNILQNTFSLSDTELLTVIVRKAAHATEYVILGLLAANLARIYKKSYMIFFAIAAIYAISDELHQLLVPGRSCELRDMLIDISGITIGMLIIYFSSKKSKH